MASTARPIELTLDLLLVLRMAEVEVLIDTLDAVVVAILVPIALSPVVPCGKGDGVVNLLQDLTQILLVETIGTASCFRSLLLTALKTPPCTGNWK